MSRDARRGFTLLEIAVAVAILGIGVVTLQQIYQGALRLQERSSRESRVVLHARAAMDALLKSPKVTELCPSPEETTREGFRWHTCIRPATPEEGASAGDKGSDDNNPSANANGNTNTHTISGDTEQTLWYVEVDVTWQDGAGSKTYTLQSLRMASAEEQ